MAEKVLFIPATYARMESGELLFVPLGVIMAICREAAYEEALQRWPSFAQQMIEPEHWENVSPDIRLLALDNDRQIFLRL